MYGKFGGLLKKLFDFAQLSRPQAAFITSPTIATNVHAGVYGVRAIASPLDPTRLGHISC